MWWTAILTFFKKIPIAAYVAVAFLAIVLLVGVLTYRDGYSDGKHIGEIKLKEYQVAKEKQISELKTQAGQVTEKVVTEYVDRIKEVTKKEYVYRDVVREIPVTCPGLSLGWVETYNASITNGALTIDTTTLDANSGISDVAALDVIVRNNSIANQNREQLISLQEWVRTNEELINGTPN